MKRLSWPFAPALTISVLSFVLPAPASAEPEFGERQAFWQGTLGVRSMYVTSPGYDPFSDHDALVQVSVGVSRTVWSEGRLSFAPGLVWDYGQQSGTARGTSSSLRAHRLALGLEGRYHILPWMYGLVRISPGILHQSANLEDPTAGVDFVANHSAFAFDSSAGLAFMIGPQGEVTSSPVRFWAAAEGGYGYATSGSLVLHADLPEGDPHRNGDVDLGSLALRGGFFRIYAAVTY